ncbi:MAG: hypothetical protein ACREEJ_18935 [Ensifer adhaerens]
MFNKKSTEEYLERAEMHEQLAAATADVLARKMHQAMAAEYRRKATEDGPFSTAPPSSTDPILKLSVNIR